MIGMSAVIFIPDDTAKTGYPQPLMLQSVMGAPLLAWLANALFDSGVGRFFLVCHDRYVEAARACLPAEAEVMTTMDSDPADLLHVFLSTAEDAEHTITVVTGPAVYLPQLAPQAAGRFPRVYGVSRHGKYFPDGKAALFVAVGRQPVAAAARKRPRRAAVFADGARRDAHGGGERAL